MIYFDNAATSYPKPFSVMNITTEALKSYSFNSGRGGYKQSLNAASKIYDVREKIGDMFSFPSSNIVFTKNCTEALNIAIKGSVKQGEHIIISSLEHNSVSRVVEFLRRERNVAYDIADFSFDDDITVSNFEKLITPQTSLIVCMYASNAFGVCFPISKLGKMCKKHNIRFVVDGAQGVGVGDIDAKRDNIDILCAPGHKCLFGAMGTGFLAFGDDIMIDSLMQGGTGSSSLSLLQPDFYPDKFEAGTLNNSGIISMGAGIEYINRIGRENIYNHELALCKYLYSELSQINDVKLYTPMLELGKNMPIIAFNYGDYSSEKVADALAKNDICVRAGYHCSPLAHKHFGTSDIGAVRISVGAFNGIKECQRLINVVKNM